MAPESPLDAAGLTADGVWLVGEYLGLRDGAKRTLASGRELQNCDLGIRLAGGVIETVNYGGRRFAEDAAAGLAKGDRCAIRVEVKFGSKDGRPWMFYAGARGGGESSSGFADEFSA